MSSAGDTVAAVPAEPLEEGLIHDDDEEGLIKDSPAGSPAGALPDAAPGPDGRNDKRDKESKHKHKDKDKDRDHKKRKRSHKEPKDREHKSHRRSKDDADDGALPPAAASDANADEPQRGPARADSVRADDRDDRRPPERRQVDRSGGRDVDGRDADRRNGGRDRPSDGDRPGGRPGERSERHREYADRDAGGPRDAARDRHRGRDLRDRDRERERGREEPRGEARRDGGAHAPPADRDGDRKDDARSNRVAERGPEAGGARQEEPRKDAGADARGGDANGAAKKPQEPLSLEDLLKRRQEAEAEAARPKFMTKKQREELALKKLHEQADVVRQSRAALQAQAQAEAERAERERRALEAEVRQNRISERERELQLQLIRQQYLGKEKTKRRVAKASEKFRFNFDWDAKDDTSKDLNPLYDKLHESGVLFGRGMLAGIDRREQLKEAAKKEQSALALMRQSRGDRATVAEMRADTERASRAEKYDEDVVKQQKHWTEKTREQMSERDWRIFREDHRISYKHQGKGAPNPYRSWDEMPLPGEIRRAINKLGYEKPSPIQMASIPFGLRNRDVIGLAETGSGKTAAFVIPMLVYIMGQPPMTDANCVDGPYSVVLAPTRELAQQIDEEATVLAEYTGFTSVCVVGGASYDEQAAKLRRGAEMVVATPGRLVDCLNRRYAVLNQCNYIVLDEADRMIDMGFEPQVMQVMDAMPSTNLKPEDEEVLVESDRVYRTTYMFSATMPPAVERIARRYLRRPVTVTVGSAGRATDNVTQRVLWTTEKEKSWRLVQELDSFQASVTDELIKVIVFVNNKVHSEEVYNALAATNKYKCALLHGGKTQEQREASIKGFREKEYDIMIATDVAGRGIDVRDVGLVINYDMPHTIENYTHRIGRTGRAGRKGTAITFLTSSNTEVFFDLRTLLEESKAHVPPELARHEAAKIKPGGFEGQSKKDTVLYATK